MCLICLHLYSHILFSFILISFGHPRPGRLIAAKSLIKSQTWIKNLGTNWIHPDYLLLDNFVKLSSHQNECLPLLLFKVLSLDK